MVRFVFGLVHRRAYLEAVYIDIGGLLIGLADDLKRLVGISNVIIGEDPHLTFSVLQCVVTTFRKPLLMAADNPDVGTRSELMRNYDVTIRHLMDNGVVDIAALF